MILHEKFNLFCWLWIGIGLVIFPVLLKVKQPYGRHATKGWGPVIRNRVGWFLMELPALLVFGYFVSFSDFKNQTVAAAVVLWAIHYIHRSIIFPFRLKTKGKMMPLVIVFSAILFNTINGFFNGYWLAHFVPDGTDKVLSNARLIIGGIVFLSGFLINQYHDRLLIQLRKDNTAGYRIPHGGFFKLISCPNYLGEIITWTGFLIVTSSLPAFAFLIWTLVNLVPRALDHHQWYQKHFPDYPSSRKALLPYIL